MTHTPSKPARNAAHAITEALFAINGPLVGLPAENFDNLQDLWNEESVTNLLAEIIDRETASAELLDAVETALAFFYNPGSFEPLGVERKFQSARRKAKGLGVGSVLAEQGAIAKGETL